jgi:hypothetical protein
MKPEIQEFRERIKLLEPSEIRNLIKEMSQQTALLVEKMQMLQEMVHAKQSPGNAPDSPNGHPRDRMVN